MFGLLFHVFGGQPVLVFQIFQDFYHPPFFESSNLEIETHEWGLISISEAPHC